MHTLRTSITTVTITTVLALTSCGAPDTDATPRSEGFATTTTQPVAPTTDGGRGTDDANSSLVARTAGPDLVVRAEPDPGSDTLAVLTPTTPFGTVRTLRVLARQGDRIQVQIPARPNDSSGWIDADTVDLGQTDFRVEVDLTRRELIVHEGDRVVVTTPIAVGAPDSPTPTGEFSVTDRLLAPDPSGDYGPSSFGISAYSDAYSEFGGGDGQIGIHGTGDPSSIGQAVSHGCVRVPNDVITELIDLLPLGTPVRIR